MSTRRWRWRWRRTAGRRSWTSRWTTSSWRPAEPEQASEVLSGLGAAGRGAAGASGAQIERAAELLRGAERPVIMAGTDLYWGHGEDALRELAETLRIPVFLNGLARGCVPADHELFFSRARGQALKGADVALVMGVPMDFRLGFGGAFGDETEIVVIDTAEPVQAAPAEGGGGVLRRACGRRSSDLRAAAGGKALRSEAWIAELRAAETRAARGGAGGARGRSRAAAPDAAVRGGREGARPRRDRDRRRRRLRVVRGEDDRKLRARAAGSTRGRSAAWAPARGMRWRRSWRTPSGRSC